MAAEELGTEDITHIKGSSFYWVYSCPLLVDTIFVGQFTCYRGCGLTNNILYFIVRMAIGIGSGSVL
jgi:Na+-driven multidrug efflux pump